MLVKDIEGMDVQKEAQSIRKNLLKNHGIDLGKRQQSETPLVSEFEPVNGSKRAKIGERFDNHTEFFTLEN